MSVGVIGQGIRPQPPLSFPRLPLEFQSPSVDLPPAADPLINTASSFLQELLKLYSAGLAKPLLNITKRIASRLSALSLHSVRSKSLFPEASVSLQRKFFREKSEEKSLKRSWGKELPRRRSGK